MDLLCHWSLVASILYDCRIVYLNKLAINRIEQQVCYGHNLPCPPIACLGIPTLPSLINQVFNWVSSHPLAAAPRAPLLSGSHSVALLFRECPKVSQVLTLMLLESHHHITLLQFPRILTDGVIQCYRQDN